MEINFLIAFTSGVVSFFAPCVVSLLPAYVGYIVGEERRKRAVAAVAYILGFSLIFTLLGTGAAGLGSLLRQNDILIQRIGGVLIMIFALNFLGVIKIPGLAWQFRLPAFAQHLGYGRAFLLGVIFATAWTPCVGAVLGAILTLAATSQSVISGGALLFVYSLGISIPFLVIALTLAQAPKALKAVEKYVGVINKVAGVMLFVIGLLLFINQYNRLNSLLFEIAFRLGYQIK